MKIEFEPVTKIFFVMPGGKDQPFCGPGMIHLLKFIDETGSVRKASEEMQISYSKCWKLLRTMEKCLQDKVAVRQQGGAGGGEAHLTDTGKAFLEKYLSFEAECHANTKKLFKKYFVSG